MTTEEQLKMALYMAGSRILGAQMNLGVPLGYSGIGAYNRTLSDVVRLLLKDSAEAEYREYMLDLEAFENLNAENKSLEIPEDASSE